MKRLSTESFERLASDMKRQPGSFPGENDNGQGSLFEGRDPKDEQSILRRWKRNKKVPTETIYQLGVTIPSAKKQ
jgi:hypothetical protein